MENTADNDFLVCNDTSTCMGHFDSFLVKRDKTTGRGKRKGRN